jgi:hypothetical protein
MPTVAEIRVHLASLQTVQAERQAAFKAQADALGTPAEDEAKFNAAKDALDAIAAKIGVVEQRLEAAVQADRAAARQVVAERTKKLRADTPKRLAALATTRGAELDGAMDALISAFSKFRDEVEPVAALTTQVAFTHIDGRLHRGDALAVLLPEARVDAAAGVLAFFVHRLIEATHLPVAGLISLNGFLLDFSQAPPTMQGVIAEAAKRLATKLNHLAANPQLDEAASVHDPGRIASVRELAAPPTPSTKT